MCGLSTIVDFEPGAGLLQSLLAMHRSIAHRGPDGEGFTLLDGQWQASGIRNASALRPGMAGNLRVGMAFRWLKIQDPSEVAAQPMASPDGTVWLMFNGEVYNFREIARELAQLGHRFASVSDTEVILAAYMRWGSSCFGRLNGMWALVLLDLRDRKIIISRDRFGIKPLFYHSDGRRLIIASEVKQLLAAGVPAVANRRAVARFIRNRRPATPDETYFEGIFAQPAATIAEIALEARADITFQPYWLLNSPVVDAATAPPLLEACTKLNDLLARSVVEHMVGKAPLGHLISGGLDSSLLAALAAKADRRSGRQSMGVSMVLATRWDRFDEQAYIDEVVSSLKLKSFRAELSPAWLKANMARITKAQEEPVAGMAVAGQFLAYATAGSHGARIVLDGQGADEIFAGYPRHQFTVLKDRARQGAIAALTRELMALWQHDARFFGYAWRQLRPMRRLAGWLGWKGGDPALRFLRYEGNDTCHEPVRETRSLCRSTALGKELLADVLTGNLRAVLAVTDRNAMAHSIEARVPYVDRRIVEFAFRLPDDYKIGAGTRKRILRLIAEHYLPQSVVTRADRIGFGAPITQWLSNDFRGELAALPDGDVFSRSHLINACKLRGYIDEFLDGRHRDSGTLWRLYAVDNFARAHAVSGI